MNNGKFVTPRLLAPLVAAAAALCVPRLAHAARCSDGSATRSDGGEQSETDLQRQRGTGDECIARDIYMMPGVSALYFQPSGGPGPFYGAGVELAPFQWSHNNDRFGPSQGGVYIRAALLTSPHDAGALALFEAGWNTSLERNSSRRFLIPYFGGAVGGLSQSTLGTAAYAYPNGGVHLYYHHNLMLDAEGGYHFPFEKVDATRGPVAQLTARFSLW
jgi:hypothetical protein